MDTYAALLRGINVGGSRKLRMSDLAELCRAAGCENVRTYIQSGNAVFTSKLAPTKLAARLEAALATKLMLPVEVILRTADELRLIAARNPFESEDPRKVLVLFLKTPPDPGRLAEVQAPGGEQLKLSGREIYIHYPNGMGRSRLKLPLAESGTGRNMNTVRKLAELATTLP